MLSLAGLLNDNYRLPSLDYHQIMSATLRLTRSMDEVAKMFRQMCFNVFIGNQDDHSKNFSFIYDGEKWLVSPAYDLVKSTGLGGEHATMVDGKGKEIEEENMMNVARGAGLDIKLALQILNEVREVV